MVWLKSKEKSQDQYIPIEATKSYKESVVGKRDVKQPREEG